MSDVTFCSKCTSLDRVIGHEVRRNETRRRRGLAPDLAALERAKDDQRACAAAGHWHRAAVPTSP